MSVDSYSPRLQVGPVARQKRRASSLRPWMGPLTSGDWLAEALVEGSLTMVPVAGLAQGRAGMEMQGTGGRAWLNSQFERRVLSCLNVCSRPRCGDEEARGIDFEILAVDDGGKNLVTVRAAFANGADQLASAGERRRVRSVDCGRVRVVPPVGELLRVDDRLGKTRSGGRRIEYSPRTVLVFVWA